jgi:hypothetical protein
MAWRVATRPGTRPGTVLLEVIDPGDWDDFPAEKQGRYQPVRLFDTEQEADKFAAGQVEAANPARTRLRRRYGP